MIEVLSTDISQKSHTYSSSGNYVVKARNVGNKLNVSNYSSTYYNNVKNLVMCKVPKSFTSLDNYCFYYCSNLSSIILSNSITSLGSYCFSYCSNLSSIALSDSVMSFGINCFSDCTNLSSIIVDSIKINFNVSNIGKRSTYLQKFGSILINENNINFYTDNDNKIILSKDKTVAKIGFDDTITLPDSITSLGNYCFYYCSNLSSIALPDTVTSLGNYCFYYCSNLSSIALPDSVTSLGKCCFSSCSNLSSITLPNSVTSLGDECFSSCSNLSSITLPDSVTSFGTNCFYYCSNLSSIALPDTVTSLGNYCFYYCSNLSSIALPDSVTSLGKCCFYCCYALKFIKLSETLKLISESAFYNNNNLSGVYFPPSIQSIGSYAFRNCSKMQYADFSNHTSIPTLNSSGSGNVFYPTTKIIVPKDLWLSWQAASNWSSISSQIYYTSNELSDQTITGTDPQEYTGNPVTPIKIYNSLYETTLIENTDYMITYQNNTEVGTATFTATGIGDYVGTVSGSFQIEEFKYTTLTIQPTDSSKTFRIYSATKKADEANIKIDWGDGTTEILTSNISQKTHTYSDTQPKQVKISDAVTDIAFGNSSYYAENKLIKSIDSYGDNLTCLGTYALYYATSLSSLNFTNSKLSNINSYALGYCNSLTSITLNDNLQQVGTYFATNSKINSIYVPSSLTSINGYFCYKCHQLSSISVDINNPTYDSRDNCNAIIITNTNSLKHGYKTTIIPSTVTSLGARSFQYADIQDVILSSNLTSVGSYVFQYCSSLSSVTIADELTSVGIGCFSYCTSLPMVIMPASTAEVKSHTFRVCVSLKMVSFDKCTSIPTLASTNAFLDIPSYCKIYVPASLMTDWKVASNWSTYASQITCKSNEISDAVIFNEQMTRLSSDGYAYPTYKIYNGNEQLVENVDFTIAFSDRQNPGICSCDVTGIGNYTGTNSFNVEIRTQNTDWFEISCDDYYPSETFGQITIDKCSNAKYVKYVDYDNDTIHDTLQNGAQQDCVLIEKIGDSWYVSDTLFDVNESGSITSQETYLSSIVSESTLFSGEWFEVIDNYDTTYRFRHVNGGQS